MADDSDRAKLEQSVQRFGEAWANGNLEVLAALLTPTYTHTDAFGAFHDRTAWLEYAAGRVGRNTHIAFRDMTTRRIGDVAIITGINDVVGQGARSADDHSPLSLRFTQIWILKDGTWLREAFQATPITKTRAS
jgi:ketosteroid isomerase-like protein